MKTVFRLWAVAIGLTAGLVYAGDSVWDQPAENHGGAKDITVYRDPYCGCCRAWIAHLEKHEFNVTDIVTNDMAEIKRKYRVPANMGSCHTAIIDGYVIEGHVPADDIRRLLKDKPDVTGLSVPQMPVGTPGMEMGNRKDPFAVFQFDDAGKFEVFKEYRAY